jgi:hypothetical protein
VRELTGQCHAPDFGLPASEGEVFAKLDLGDGDVVGVNLEAGGEDGDAALDQHKYAEGVCLV